MLGGRAGLVRPPTCIWVRRWERVAPAASLFVGTRPGYGLCRQFFPRQVLLPCVRGLSEGDAWHVEEGLADFLGAFNVGDLEEALG